MSFTNYSNRNLRTESVILQMLGSFIPQLDAYNSPSLVGLRNYVGVLFGQLGTVLSGFNFWRILLFNFIWTLINVVFHVGIGVAVAVLLNQDGLHLKRFYRAIYIIPWAMPGLVTAMIWRNMFDDQAGAINVELRRFDRPFNRNRPRDTFQFQGDTARERARIEHHEARLMTPHQVHRACRYCSVHPYQPGFPHTNSVLQVQSESYPW